MRATEEDGIEISYVLGNACQTQRAAQPNSEAVKVKLMKILFADDTSILLSAETMEAAKQEGDEAL